MMDFWRQKNLLCFAKNLFAETKKLLLLFYFSILIKYAAILKWYYSTVYSHASYAWKAVSQTCSSMRYARSELNWSELNSSVLILRTCKSPHRDTNLISMEVSTERVQHIMWRCAGISSEIGCSLDQQQKFLSCARLMAFLRLRGIDG